MATDQRACLGHVEALSHPLHTLAAVSVSSVCAARITRFMTMIDGAA